MKKAFFIFNPVAGKGTIKNNLFKVVDYLTKAGYEVTAYPTQTQGDDRDALKKLKYTDFIVVSGGDGTLRNVITGYLENGNLDCPIGYLPAGTANDFANTLNLSRNLPNALNTLCHGRNQAVDVGRFNQEYFIYIAAFGAFTKVSYSTPQFNKNILGHFAYILEGITQLSQIKSYKCKIIKDDEVIEDQFIFGMISNSDSVGGMKRLFGPEAELSDGLFEVCLIKQPKQLSDLRQIVGDLLNQQNDKADNPQIYEQEAIIIFKTNHLTITSQEPISWTLDGEDGGSHEQVDIVNCPSVISIVTD